MSEPRVFLDKPGDGLASFGMRFGPIRCKILLQNSVGLRPNMVLAELALDKADKPCYLSSNKRW